MRGQPPSEVSRHLEDRLEADPVPGLHAPDSGTPFVGTHRPAVVEFNPVMDGNTPSEDFHMESVGPERPGIPDHETVDQPGRDTVPPEGLRPEESEVGAVAPP